MTKEEYKEWCKKTKRNGGVLIGSSIHELIEAINQENVAITKERDELRKENQELKSGEWAIMAVKSIGEISKERDELESALRIVIRDLREQRDYYKALAEDDSPK